MTRRSRAALSRASRLLAVSPPTIASGSASSSVVRSVWTVRRAAVLSGATASVASSRTSPSTTTGSAPGQRRAAGERDDGGDAVGRRGRLGDRRPVLLGRDDDRRAGRTGVEVPAERLLPVHAVRLALDRVGDRDAVGVVGGREDARRRSGRPALPRAPGAGRRPTSAATRCQPRPRLRLAAVPRAERPERGAAEQRQRRGQEGERGEDGEGDADRGDRARARGWSRGRRSSRQRTPRTTVAPEATIGSQDWRSAIRIAVYFDSSRRSSSRNRATSSRP